MPPILPAALVDMDALAGPALRVECAYAREDNLLFGERIYRKNARVFLHEILARVVAGAAALAEKSGHRLVLYDGLRTVEAQEKMLRTRRVRENPQWLEEPRLLSPPGAGAHPRGMAIDLGLETAGGDMLDMGTPFDFLAADPAPEHNPAHRLHPALPAGPARNRALLDSFMLSAARALDTPLHPLPQEWWDYRLPAEIWQESPPLHDHDLPPEMRLCP